MLRLSGSKACRYADVPEHFLSCPKGPDDAGVFVGEGDRRLLPAESALEVQEPRDKPARRDAVMSALCAPSTSSIRI